MGFPFQAAFFRPFFTAARFTAQRFFIASASFRRPSGVKFGFRFAGVAAEAAASTGTTLFAAHRFRCPSERLLDAAGGRPRRFAGTLGTAFAGTPSMSRRAASASPIAVFRRSSCAMMPSNPSAIIMILAFAVIAPIITLGKCSRLDRTTCLLNRGMANPERLGFGFERIEAEKASAPSLPDGRRHSGLSPDTGTAQPGHARQRREGRRGYPEGSEPTRNQARRHWRQ